MRKTDAEPAARWQRALGLGLLAWAVPGAGHLVLGKRVKALVFFILIVLALIIGCQLDGRLYSPVAGQPLSLLGTLASLGSGLGYLGLRFILDYSGDVVSRGYEYGTAFLVTAGLMNWLVVLDVWDRARGVVPAGDRQADADADGPRREGQEA
ncbi:MAG: DUF6677 family protein [Thermoanaerobaculia bacterium]